MNENRDPMKQNPAEATHRTASDSRETRRTERSAGSSVNRGASPAKGTPCPGMQGARSQNGQAAPSSDRRTAASGARSAVPPRNPQGKPNTPQSQHRKGSVILFRILIGVGAALALYLIIRLLLLLVPINTVIVPEESFLTAEELCEAARLSEGDRMYGFSESGVKKELLKEYPILSDIKFERGFDGTLKMIPIERECDFYVNVSGTYCVLSRADFCVLFATENNERLVTHGFYEISLPDVRVAFVGEILEFGKEGENEYLNVLLEAIDQSELSERITGIRAAKRFDLSVIIDGKYDVKLGNVSEIERKLEQFLYLERSHELFQTEGHAEIYLTDLSAPSVRPVDQVDVGVS